MSFTLEKLDEATRPIIGIENRTAEEAFGIMCDRIRSLRATLSRSGEAVGESVDHHAYRVAHIAPPPVPTGYKLVPEEPTALNGKYGDVLAPFVSMMEAELHANSGKGDRPGWLAMSREELLLEIYYHLAKLQKAALKDDAAGIREFGADVANMSMMLVDKCEALPAAPPAPAPQERVKSLEATEVVSAIMDAADPVAEASRLCGYIAETIAHLKGEAVVAQLFETFMRALATNAKGGE